MFQNNLSTQVQSYGAGDVAIGLALADVNHDGKLDLVTSGFIFSEDTTFGQIGGNMLAVRMGDGLQLSDCYIAAAVRCAPPDNKPAPDEIVNCLPHLDAEIAALPRIRVVVGLGRIAFDAYLRLLATRGTVVSPRPAFAHGSVAALPDGRTLIGFDPLCLQDSRCS